MTDMPEELGRQLGWIGRRPLPLSPENMIVCKLVLGSRAVSDAVGPSAPVEVACVAACRLIAQITESLPDPVDRRVAEVIFGTTSQYGGLPVGQRVRLLAKSNAGISESVYAKRRPKVIRAVAVRLMTPISLGLNEVPALEVPPMEPLNLVSMTADERDEHDQHQSVAQIGELAQSALNLHYACITAKFVAKLDAELSVYDANLRRPSPVAVWLFNAHIRFVCAAGRPGWFEKHRGGPHRYLEHLEYEWDRDNLWACASRVAMSSPLRRYLTRSSARRLRGRFGSAIMMWSAVVGAELLQLWEAPAVYHRRAPEGTMRLNFIESETLPVTMAFYECWCAWLDAELLLSIEERDSFSADIDRMAGGAGHFYSALNLRSSDAEGVHERARALAQKIATSAYEFDSEAARFGGVSLRQRLDSALNTESLRLVLNDQKVYTVL